MATVNFRSTATANSGASTTTSLAINKPSGTLQNDQMIVWMTVTGGTGVTVTAPAGWTSVITTNSTTVYGQRLFRKVATSSEPSSYTFTFSVACNVAINLCSFSGVRINGGAVGSLGQSSSTGSTTGTSSASGRTLNGMFIKLVSSYRAATGGCTVSNPGSGYTTYSDVTNTASASNFVQAAVIGGVYNTTTANTTLNAVTLSASMDNNFIITTAINVDVTDSATVILDSGSPAFAIGVSTLNVSHLQSTPGELAYIAVAMAGSANSVTSITSTGLTWSRVSQVVNTSDITVELWKTRLGTNTSSGILSTINFNTTLDAATYEMVFFNAADTGTVATAQADTGVATTTLSTSNDNSWVYGLLAYPGNVSATAASGSDILHVANASLYSLNILKRSAITATSGTSTTVAASAPTTTQWAEIEFETKSPNTKGDFMGLV